MARSKLKLPSKSKGQSRITNGQVLPLVDGRSADARRWKSLMSAYLNDLGGDAVVSEGQRAIIRRAITIQIELERLEQKFANEVGASTNELEVYQRASSTLRRLIETLRIHRGRIARTVNAPDLDDYLDQKSRNDNRNGHGRRQERVRVIDHEVED